MGDFLLGVLSGMVIYQLIKPILPVGPITLWAYRKLTPKVGGSIPLTGSIIRWCPKCGHDYAHDGKIGKGCDIEDCYFSCRPRWIEPPQ